MGEKGAGREGKVTALASSSFDQMGRVVLFGHWMELSIGREWKRIEESSCWGWPPQTPLVVGTNKARQPPSLPPQASLQSVLKGGSFFQLSPNPPRLNSQKGAWGNSNSSPSHLQSKYRSKKINQFNPGSIRVPILEN
ncbi:hypothetical protein PPACK8108_LOCUS4738 [Phakopsora pachyrhizi]|uniref:Uncharacterized protein n=1 Tax=Phakopsora pachyrhizi TaxID=170000 RepID=A0AAV0AMX0_PHAPC|nr:hypothetical protein PPACK8108_LOCUS4738 [Phakopsora pachyrhizi]